MQSFKIINKKHKNLFPAGRETDGEAVEQNAATYTKANITQYKSHSVRPARRKEFIGHKVEEYSQILMCLCL